jgi:hypothetical protein
MSAVSTIAYPGFFHLRNSLDMKTPLPGPKRRKQTPKRRKDAVPNQVKTTT